MGMRGEVLRETLSLCISYLILHTHSYSIELYLYSLLHEFGTIDQQNSNILIILHIHPWQAQSLIFIYRFKSNVYVFLLNLSK